MKANQKITLIASIAALLLTSCVFVVNGEQDKAASYKNRGGIYHGVLPCASCPGIDTWLEISGGEKDARFILVERYLEEEEGGIFTSHGRVEIIKEKSAEKAADKTILILHGKNDTRKFAAADESLILLGNTEEKPEDETSYTLYKMPDFAK